MLRLQLRQPGFFVQSLWAIYQKKKTIQTTKKMGDVRYIYQNELDKAYYQYDKAYEDFLRKNSFS